MRESGNRVQLVTLYTRVVLELIEHPRISQEMLARRLDVTMRTAQRHLTELEEEEYIMVDRDKKPFEYTINWSKAWPFMPWLRVVMLHPEVRGAVHGISELAYHTFELAAAAGQNQDEALKALFAQGGPAPVGIEGVGVA